MGWTTKTEASEGGLGEYRKLRCERGWGVVGTWGQAGVESPRLEPEINRLRDAA